MEGHLGGLGDRGDSWDRGGHGDGGTTGWPWGRWGQSGHGIEVTIRGGLGDRGDKEPAEHPKRGEKPGFELVPVLTGLQCHRVVTQQVPPSGPQNGVVLPQTLAPVARVAAGRRRGGAAFVRR